MAAILPVLLVVSISKLGYAIRFNYTPSLPVGFYLINLRDREIQRQEIVNFPVPNEVKEMVFGRHWLVKGAAFLKPAGGVAGDVYCVQDGKISINGKHVAKVYSRDSQGRKIPHIVGCHTLKDGNFLPVSTYYERSFDGRYFGEVKTKDIIGTARPILVFNNEKLHEFLRNFSL